MRLHGLLGGKEKPSDRAGIDRLLDSLQRAAAIAVADCSNLVYYSNSPLPEETEGHGKIAPETGIAAH